jgi:hypothetical protein
MVPVVFGCPRFGGATYGPAMSTRFSSRAPLPVRLLFKGSASSKRSQYLNSKNSHISQVPRHFVKATEKNPCKRMASDEAVNLKAKSSVALTRSGGRQIQQPSRHE